jgi:hypothetical protein
MAWLITDWIAADFKLPVIEISNVGMMTSPVRVVNVVAVMTSELLVMPSTV